MPAILSLLLPLLGFGGGSAISSLLLGHLAKGGAKWAGSALAQHTLPFVGGAATQMGLEAILNPPASASSETNDIELAKLANHPQVRQNQLMELLLQDHAQANGFPVSQGVF